MNNCRGLALASITLSILLSQAGCAAHFGILAPSDKSVVPTPTYVAVAWTKPLQTGSLKVLLDNQDITPQLRISGKPTDPTGTADGNITTSGGAHGLLATGSVLESNGYTPSSSEVHFTTGSSGPVADLPRGLTCGLTYYDLDCGFDFWDFVVHGQIVGCENKQPSMETGQCKGTQTITTVATLDNWPIGCDPTVKEGPNRCINMVSMITHAAANYALVFDGDFGLSEGSGFYHQELSANGTVDSSLSDKFKLPKGAVCGFHHTRNSPVTSSTMEHSCMGFDPSRGQCPKGWSARKQFDMSSDTGYWAWCEYQDPYGYCASADCINSAVAAGVSCGVSSNVENGGFGACGGFATKSKCPDGTQRTAFYDDGRDSNQGLGWCKSP